MCFGCAHRRDMGLGIVPEGTSFDDYMENYFWKNSIKIPEGKDPVEFIQEAFNEIAKNYKNNDKTTEGDTKDD